MLEGVIKEFFDAADLDFLRKKLRRLSQSDVRCPIYDQIQEWIAPGGDKEGSLPFGKSSFGRQSEFQLFLSSLGVCAICQDTPSGGALQVAGCSHIFCEECLDGARMDQQADSSTTHFCCPACGKPVEEWSTLNQQDGDACGSRGVPGSVDNRKNKEWKPPVYSQWLELAESNPEALPPSGKTIAVKAL